MVDSSNLKENLMENAHFQFYWSNRNNATFLLQSTTFTLLQLYTICLESGMQLFKTQLICTHLNMLCVPPKRIASIESKFHWPTQICPYSL